MGRKKYLWVASAASCLAIGFTAGCSGSGGLKYPSGSDAANLAPVTGKITLDGKSLANAYVAFEGANDRVSTGVTNGEGEYRLENKVFEKGAPIGSNRVRIYSNGAPALPGQPDKTIPARYNLNSNETVEVKPGKNRFDFALTTP